MTSILAWIHLRIRIQRTQVLKENNTLFNLLGGIKGFTLFLRMKFSASRKIDIKWPKHIYVLVILLSVLKVYERVKKFLEVLFFHYLFYSPFLLYQLHLSNMHLLPLICYPLVSFLHLNNSHVKQYFLHWSHIHNIWVFSILVTLVWTKQLWTFQNFKNFQIWRFMMVKQCFFINFITKLLRK